MKPRDTSVSEARRAIDDACACTSVDCKATTQRRFTAAASTIEDRSIADAMAAELSACLSREHDAPWAGVVADACRCSTTECAADIERRTLVLARTSDEATAMKYADEVARCLAEHDEGVIVLSRIRDEACACTEIACLEKIQKDLASAANMKTRYMERVTTITEEISACIQRLAPK